MDRRRNAALNSDPAVPTNQPDGGDPRNIHGHLPALDGLRGVAILLVLLHHFDILHQADALARTGLSLLDLGKHGVDLFFVLSGFLITGILLDTRGQRGYFTSFFARRALRILPLYYLVVGYFLVFLPWFHRQNPETLATAMRWSAEAARAPWYFGFASNVLFAITGDFGPAGLDITWSLAIEEQFYLLWALLVFLLPRRGMMIACLVLIVAGPVCRAATGWLTQSWMAAYLLTPGRLDGLALGGLIAALYRSPGMTRARMRGWAAWLGSASLSGLVLLQLPGWLNGFTPGGVILGLSLVAGLSGAALVFAVEADAQSRWGVIARSAPLRFFGRYSYGMYLLHMPIAVGLKRALFPDNRHLAFTGGALWGWQVAYLVLGMALTVAAAWLVFRLIEQPFLKLKKFVPRPQALGASNSPS